MQQKTTRGIHSRELADLSPTLLHNLHWAQKNLRIFAQVEPKINLLLSTFTPRLEGEERCLPLSPGYTSSGEGGGWGGWFSSIV
jgi:hypothetical protein